MWEVIQIVELLFRGPSGWLVLGVSTAISVGVTYFGVRHQFKRVRNSTHALLGGDGKFKTQDEGDIDDMFRSFSRYEQKAQAMLHDLGKGHGDARPDMAKHLLKIADSIIDECIQMAEMNLAFRTKAAHREFFDRINERYRRAEQIRVLVAKAQKARQSVKAG